MDSARQRGIGAPVPPQEDPLIGRLLDGRYLIKSVIASGGMGTVYRAEQRSMSRDVAVKVLRTDLEADSRVAGRILTEAMAASRLRNPHTITVFDFGYGEDGVVFLVMELLFGQTLGEWMRANGAPMDVARAICMVGQVLDSLEEAHDVGVLHRDLKPDNIFLMDGSGARDFIKVLDFGVAKIAGEAGIAAGSSGLALGTPIYMSPEQMMGGELDPRSDLYSLGVVLFELLTGRPPFEGDSALDLARQKVRQVPPSLRDINPEARFGPTMESLLGRLLAANPADRPEDAAALRTLLAEAIHRQNGQESPETERPAPGPAVAFATARTDSPAEARPVSGGAAMSMSEPPEPTLLDAAPVPNARPPIDASGLARNADRVRKAASELGRKPMLVPGADRRADSRQACLLKVSCVQADIPRTAFVANISRSGGYVHADWLPQVRERLALVFPAQEGGASEVTVVAEVVRVVSTPTQPGVVRGFSVRWLSLRCRGRLEGLARFYRSVFGEILTVPFSLDTESSYWEYSFATRMLVNSGV